MKAIIVLLVLLASLDGCGVRDDAQEGTCADKVMLSFSFTQPPAPGEIDQRAGTILVPVPAGTTVTALAAAFTTTGEKVTVDGAPQVSGISVNDFASPVVYVVHARDGSSASYVVTVSPAEPLSAEKAIASFAFRSPQVAGVVDQHAHAIRVDVPCGTDVTSLVAVFATRGVRVFVDDTEQESGVTINDFTAPQPYVVTAEDGSRACYLVTVVPAPSSRKSITSFAITAPPAAGMIDEDARVIRVRVPADTDRGSLVARFATTGSVVSVDGIRQDSGVTPNDFSAPVSYAVTAEDGSAASYEVRVTGAFSLVVSELDVDQPGADAAEFVKLYAPAEVDLAGLALVLLNGGVSPGQEYARVDLTAIGELAAGSYLVIAGPNVFPDPSAVKYEPKGWDLSNRIQNGPGDAVMIYDFFAHRVIDTVSYNGVLRRAIVTGESAEVDATEGAAGAPADTGTAAGSIARSPDAQDSGQNGADFRFSPTLTPGGPNP